MNSNAECQLSDVKEETDLDPIIQMKCDPEDIRMELKTETEDCDMKDGRHPQYDLISNIDIKSEVETKFVAECFEVKQQNIDDNETTVYDCGVVYEENLCEEECVVTNGDESSLNKYSCFENSFNIGMKNIERDLKSNIYDDCVTNNTSNNIDINLVSGEMTFTSNICRKSFRDDHSLTELVCPTNEKPFKCDICGKLFSKKNYLSAHVRIHTNEKTFNCDVCGKSFSRNAELKRHLRTHTNEKPFKCGECNTSFTHKQSLIVHIRIHTSDKPFKCVTCLKSFYRKQQMTDHMRSHTNEKPFKCTVCCKSFSYKQHLNRHTRSHTNEKPFICSICFKPFSRKQHLDFHMHIHKTDKPFKCTFCCKSYSQKHHLIAHVCTHTNEKPFKCSFCSKSFTRKYVLDKHVHIHKYETVQL